MQEMELNGLKVNKIYSCVNRMTFTTIKNLIETLHLNCLFFMPKNIELRIFVYFYVKNIKTEKKTEDFFQTTKGLEI